MVVPVPDLQDGNRAERQILQKLRTGGEVEMRFTDEMITEDEKRWGERNILVELGYCSSYMPDRKYIRTDDMRFYAYIMRKAHEMLKAQEPSKVIGIHEVEEGLSGNCSRCGALLDGFYNSGWCGTCGEKVEWK